MILIAVGSNLASDRFGTPLATCTAALDRLEGPEIQVLARSRWYRTAPVPPSDQPWFINGVAQVGTALTAEQLLQRMHAIEHDFGRERKQRNEARVIDLDLLAYNEMVTEPTAALRLPHPRLAERAFVVLPLAEMVPEWRHPVSGLTAVEMADRLPAGQVAEALTGEEKA